MFISNKKKNIKTIFNRQNSKIINVINFENKVKQKIYLFCVLRVVSSFNVLESR